MRSKKPISVASATGNGWKKDFVAAVQLMPCWHRSLTATCQPTPRCSCWERRTSRTKGSGWHCNKSTESKTRSGASYLAQIGETAQGQILMVSQMVDSRETHGLSQTGLTVVSFGSIVNVTMSISSRQWILTNKDVSIKWSDSSFKVRLFELLDTLDWIGLDWIAL